MIYQIKLAILVASICAPIAMVCTRLLGARAERWPVAALMPALAVHEAWLLAFTAGIAWHFLALRVWHAAHRTTPAYLGATTACAVGACGTAAMVTIYLAASTVTAALTADNDAAWARVAASGAAGEYVARFYRGCTEQPASYAPGRLALIESAPRPDPLTCAHKTVDLAREARGEAFASAVANAIETLPSQFTLTPQGKAAIDGILRR